MTQNQSLPSRTAAFSLRNLCMVSAFIFGCTSTSAAQWISNYLPATCTLKIKNTVDTIRFPLRLHPKVSMNTVKMLGNGPVYVTFGNDISNRAASSFKFNLNKKRTALEVIALTDRMREKGTYEMVFLFSAPNRDTVKIPITIVRPAATLDTVQSLLIKITGGDIVKNKFAIRETGKSSGFHGVDLKSPDIRGMNGDLITFPKGKFYVPAGGRFDTAYQVNESLIDNLPLGKTKAAMEIDSPELSVKLIVPVVIINQIARGWIFFIVLTGLAFGALVRHVLKPKRELEAKKSELVELWSHIENESNGIKDRQFQQDRSQLIRQLRQAIRDGVSAIKKHELIVADLKTTLEHVSTEFKTLKKNYDIKLTDIKQKVETLSTIFKDSRLTALLHQQRPAAQVAFKESVKNLKENDASQAEVNYNDTTKEISRFLTKFSNDLNGLLSKITSGKLLPCHDGNLMEILKSHGETFNKYPEEIKTRINDDKIPEAYHHANYALESLTITYKNISNAITPVFEKSENQAPDPEQFEKAFRRWLLSLEKSFKDPAEMIDLNAVKELKALWDKIPPQKEVVESAPFIGEQVPWKDLKYPRAEKLGIVVTNEKTDYLAEMARAIRFKWFTLSLLQFLILSAITIAGVFTIYEPNFIGKPQEIFTLFLFSFSLDITVDSLLTLKKA